MFDHVRPDTTRFVLLGHSAGGNLAAQIAALASDPQSDIPLARALVVLMPGEVIPVRQPSLDRIPALTLVLVVVGEEDLVVGDLRARQIFTEATSVPRARKRFILFRSDRHGYPPLVAEHGVPTGINHRLDTGEGLFRSLQKSFGDVNALDRAGFWRMTDLTLEAAFDGKTLDDATKDLERFRHLGYWSDGRRVTPPIVGDDLTAIPRVIPGNGLRIFPLSAPSKPSVALDSSANLDVPAQTVPADGAFGAARAIPPSRSRVAGTLPVVIRQQLMISEVGTHNAQWNIQHARLIAEAIEMLAPAVKRVGSRSE